jgi:hypothetical protein
MSPDFAAFIKMFHPDLVGISSDGTMFVSTHAHQTQWMSRFTKDLCAAEETWREHESKEDATSRDVIESVWTRRDGQWVKTHTRSFSRPPRATLF